MVAVKIHQCSRTCRNFLNDAGEIVDLYDIPYPKGALNSKQ